MLHTYPPSEHISSTPISITDGADKLEQYLFLSETNAHLHPDCTFTQQGVDFSAHGALGGVEMHNLRRVLRGLRGEMLEPEKTPEPEDLAGPTSNEVLNGEKIAVAGVVGAEEKTAAEAAAEEGWQSMEEYQREQGVTEVGEIGDRGAHVVSVGEEPEIHVVDEEMQAAEAGEKRKAEKVDKEARKKAKKERKKEMQREKSKKKAHQESSEDEE